MTADHEIRSLVWMPLRAVCFLLVTVRVSPSQNLVYGVVLGRSQSKVGRIAAPAVIARVEHMCPDGDRSLEECV